MKTSLNVLAVEPNPTLATPRILAFATQGAGGNEEQRIAALLSDLSPELFPFDRSSKRGSFWRLLKAIRTTRPQFVVMEGTGVAGGVALLLGRLIWGIPYVLSSGDAVGPWIAIHSRLAAPLFALYERILCRWSSGFIGWTPYLVGRALTFGAPRAITAAGWAPFRLSPERACESRIRVRARLGIAADTLVLGVAGSLAWSRRWGYCYGLELVQALLRTTRSNVAVLVVGDGPGRERLADLAGSRLGVSVHLPGRVPQEEVMEYLAAMDVASLPQSVDAVGSFRYTTKLSEYLATGVPVVTGQIPLGYDLDDGWLWRLPGSAPWRPDYIQALAFLMDNLTPTELAVRRAAVPRHLPEFDRERQIARVGAFLRETFSLPAPR